MTQLSPRIVVASAAQAIPFYIEVFGARELRRDTGPDGRVLNAELAIGTSLLTLTDEAPDYNLAPSSLGGSPVLLTLELEDPDAVWKKAVAKGAKVIFELADHTYGHRAGRLQDPAGHIWILYKVL